MRTTFVVAENTYELFLRHRKGTGRMYLRQMVRVRVRARVRVRVGT